MLNRKTIGIIVIVAVIAVVAVVVIHNLFSPASKEEETQVWWIASDPHLGYYSLQPVSSLQVAIQDVNDLGIADHAAILGDLVHNQGGYADDFTQLMDNLKVEKWYYILGNHDFDRGTRENVLPVFYGGVDVLGIRFVFISTEVGYEDGIQVMDGRMGSEQFEWLWNELYTHRNQPIFMFSHQPYYEWNTFGDLVPLIQGEISLKAWFCGHLHYWVINENVQPYNFIYVCDNSLDWSQNYAGVFLFLHRAGDTVDVTIKFRNHLNHEWISVQTVDNRTIENISFSVKVA
jgi:hypothetical protein